MELPISISNQAYIFLCSVIGGMLIAFIYDVFRIKRKTVRTRSVSIYIEDFTYWIIVALVMFGMVYYSNDGQLRGFIFIGSVIGVILYMLLLSKIVIKVSILIIKIVTRILKTVWFLITYPIRVILKILWIPTKWLLKLLGKGLRITRRAGRTGMTKAAFRYRMFRNARKKI